MSNQAINDNAINEVLKSINYMIQTALKKTTQCYNGLVVSSSNNGKWNVQYNGEVHSLPVYGAAVPTLNSLVNIINDIPNGNDWAEYLSINNNKEIRLLKPFDEGRLSKKDKYFIQLISDKYKTYTTSQLVDYTHTLPEWKEPKDTNHKIRFVDIMKALGKSDEEIIYAKKEYDGLSELYASLGLK